MAHPQELKEDSDILGVALPPALVAVEANLPSTDWLIDTLHDYSASLEALQHAIENVPAHRALSAAALLTPLAVGASDEATGEILAGLPAETASQMHVLRTRVLDLIDRTDDATHRLRVLSMTTPRAAPAV
jgi:hypothetical protein